MRLVLASRSPRRAELLRGLRLPFEVVPADVDESLLAEEAADAYVARLARTKAEAVRARLDGDDLLVLGADTTVEIDGRILGKPADQDEGVAMLLALSGRTHRVATGIAVAGPAGTECACVVAEVEFRDVDRAEAEAYWATGEPADKAGGYGLQGIGGIFVTGIRGSASAVVGLPVAETEQLLRRCGMDTWHERLQG